MGHIRQPVRQQSGAEASSQQPWQGTAQDASHSAGLGTAQWTQDGASGRDVVRRAGLVTGHGTQDPRQFSTRWDTRQHGVPHGTAHESAAWDTSPCLIWPIGPGWAPEQWRRRPLLDPCQPQWRRGRPVPVHRGQPPRRPTALNDSHKCRHGLQSVVPCADIKQRKFSTRQHA